jgi:hypothetical protein
MAAEPGVERNAARQDHDQSRQIHRMAHQGVRTRYNDLMPAIVLDTQCRRGKAIDARGPDNQEPAGRACDQRTGHKPGRNCIGPVTGHGRGPRRSNGQAATTARARITPCRFRKVRFARNDDVTRQESDTRQCLRTARSEVCRARPSQVKRESAPHYNSWRISKEFGAGTQR